MPQCRQLVSAGFCGILLIECKHIITGWWFGTWLLFLHHHIYKYIYIYTGNSNPNWLIFFRGVGQPPTIYNYIYKVQVSPQLHGEATYHHLVVNSLGQCFIFWLGRFIPATTSNIVLSSWNIKYSFATDRSEAMCYDLVFETLQLQVAIPSREHHNALVRRRCFKFEADECPLKMSFHSLEERVAPPKKIDASPVQ